MLYFCVLDVKYDSFWSYLSVEYELFCRIILKHYRLLYFSRNLLDGWICLGDVFYFCSMKSYLIILLLLLGTVSVVAQPDKNEKERTSYRSSVAYPLRTLHVTSPYGIRTDPITKKKAKHNGLDLKAHYEPTYAMLYGKVIAVGRCSRAGIYVTLQHGNFTVSYCHLSKTSVLKGSVVYPGDVVGTTGNTGRSTGPHLHLTCKYKNKCINPSRMIEFITRVKRYDTLG